MGVDMQQLLNTIVVPALLTFLMVGGVAGVVLGLGLCVRSDLVMRAGERLNRWVSFRQVLKPAEIPRDSWALVQRNRRVLAVLVVLGAAYTIYGLRLIDGPASATRVAERLGIGLSGASWLVESAVAFLIVGNGFAILVSALLGFAPDLLAKLDARSSRWISTRNAFRTASEINCTFDHWVEHWPRATGATIAFFSVVEIVSVARVMH
jgi:hypothetical protein